MRAIIYKDDSAQETIGLEVSNDSGNVVFTYGVTSNYKLHKCINAEENLGKIMELMLIKGKLAKSEDFSLEFVEAAADSGIILGSKELRFKTHRDKHEALQYRFEVILNSL